jgi:surfactin synthase thioesterase subunit
LSCPLTAFGGRDDADFPAALLEAWSLHTTGPFAAHVIDGGHLFLEETPGPLLRLVAQHLTQGTP